MDNGGDNAGIYEIPTETDLKEYYVKEESYYGVFGTGKVIAPINELTGNNRFYVMALEDINPGTEYCWYENAIEYEDSIVDYFANDFGEGKENTVYFMNKWKNSSWGPQNNNDENPDMWGVIEDEINEGWFVPSKSEWSAFLKAFRLSNGNYENYKLSDCYFSSSIYVGLVFTASIAGEFMDQRDMFFTSHVRLSRTF